MPKILKFTGFALRDFFATAAPTLLAIVVLCALAYWLVDPTPPGRVTISTGQENSGYEEFAKKYAASLAKYDIEATLQPSLGSQENLQRLIASAAQKSPGSARTDIAFVQSGSTEEGDATQAGLVSLGSLFTEPVWLFFPG